MAAETHQSESLDKLAAKSTSSNHESVDFVELFLDVPTVNGGLRIISIVPGCSVFLAIVYCLEDIVVQPLSERHVLSGKLDNFLSHNSSEESRKRRDRVSRVRYRFLQDALLKFINFVVSDVNSSDDFFHCVPVSGSRVPVVLFLEFPDSLEGKMQLVRPAKEAEVRAHKHTFRRRGSRV